MAPPRNQQKEPITYEQYMAEGEVTARYDITDGVRRYLTNPTRTHQRIAGNIYALLRRYELWLFGAGKRRLRG